MGFRTSHDRENEEESSSFEDPAARLDHTTIRRIENALADTVDVDVTKLTPDDKLTLLIERYNRKMRELEQLKHQGK